MGYCIYVYIRRGSDATMILLRSLDIITIVVPPALPAAMTVGTYYAQSRLKKSKIFCISPQRINICGKLKLVCFDKTGTLTEDGLDMYGVQTTNMSWRQLECNTSATDEINEFHENIEKDVASLPFKSPVMTCLAACHSLTLIDNQLTGDPLDVKMFEATGWSLEEEGQDTSKFDMLMPSVVRPPREALRRHKSVASLSSTNSANTGTTADPNLTSLLDPDHYPHEVGIIRQFTFSSSVARMSVITRALGDNHFHVFTKGAPEKMEDLCLPHTLPPDFHDNLKTLTLKGYRVIGLAHRRLPLEINWLKAQKMKRDQAEKNLVFLGFLIMQNTLKPETTPVIEELIAANIRCVMVTGDNLLTAVSVARDCQMVPVHHKVLIVEASIEEDEELLQPASIRFVTTEDSPNIEPHDYVEEANGVTELANLSSLEAGQIMKHNYHFAMSGKSWGVLRVHFPHLLYKIIQRGTVFARMSPEQKAQLVEEYQAIDYVVSMCGDGANDCGALKAAHVGISLSEAEASVAAPFTSRVADITCVPTVIREGRCALVTSFGVFKYMALYSMVQFISVLLLYTLLTNLGDAQFLYIDLVITTTVAVLMGWTKAYDKLVPQRPPGSLVSGPNMVSIFSQILVTMAIQVGAYLYLKQQSWYEPLHPATPETEIILCWETTAIFYVSSFQYLILAAVFSKGKPYRQPFYTNIPFFTALVVLAAFTVLITLYPGPTLANFLELMYNYGHPTTHLKFRLLLIGLAGLNLVLCIFIEKAIVERRWLKTVVHILMRKTRPKNKFKIIQREMDEQGWPNVSPMHLS
jgi:cation-transporting ATPase 13A3/4/5